MLHRPEFGAEVFSLLVVLQEKIIREAILGDLHWPETWSFLLGTPHVIPQLWRSTTNSRGQVSDEVQCKSSESIRAMQTPKLHRICDQSPNVTNGTSYGLHQSSFRRKSWSTQRLPKTTAVDRTHAATRSTIRVVKELGILSSDHMSGMENINWRLRWSHLVS